MPERQNLPAPGGFRESLHDGGCIHSGWNPVPSQSSASTTALRSDTPEGATGIAKLLRGDKQVLVWAKPVASLIYHGQGRRM